LQVYKPKKGLGDWSSFVATVEDKFGAYDYKKAIQELSALKQDGSVEEYTGEFEVVQFHVSMLNAGFDDMFFTSHFINGLKDGIRGVVQIQLPDSVDRASMLVRIQQQIVEKGKYKHVKQSASKPNTTSNRAESSHSAPTSTLWKERQLRDFKRANNLCYFCGDKFDADHLQKCTKRNKPQLHALVVNDLDAPLTEETGD
jgi:hypothetical protein